MSMDSDTSSHDGVKDPSGYTKQVRTRLGPLSVETLVNVSVRVCLHSRVIFIFVYFVYFFKKVCPTKRVRGSYSSPSLSD